MEEMPSYVKKKMPLGYVKATDVLPVGTPITIRTLEGDVDMTVDDQLIIMIGIKGEVYPNSLEKFSRSYEATQKPYGQEDTQQRHRTIYEPTLHNRATGEVLRLIDYARICIASGGTHIHARELTKRVKVFTAWDDERYMLGKAGDYLAVQCDDRHDVYVVEREIFYSTYERCESK